jgi:hypothetical protein
MIFLAVLVISLIASVGARAQWNTGDPYIPCYPSEYVYNYPKTTIPHGQTGVFFNIPSNPCPPVKIIQIGEQQAQGTVQNAPTYRYECSLSSDQGCCIANGGSYILVCAEGQAIGFNVITYDAQGEINDDWDNIGNCLYVSVQFIDEQTRTTRTATRFEVVSFEGSTTVTPTLYYECCYDCRRKQEPPATILYPKVDIENFAVAGGATIINDGKLLTNLTLSPGTQQTFIQVENRGFFTQNDARIRFEGLPAGVTVTITPETQKLKSQNIGTYSATFTVGPNVPSGKYQVTLIAYSEKGMFDKITFEFIVP